MKRIVRDVRAAALAATAVFFAARLSYALDIAGVVAVWFPSGVLLALLLLSRRSRWLLLLAGAYAGNWAADLHSVGPVVLQFLGPLVNVSESLLAARLIQYVGGRENPVTSTRGAGALILGAAVFVNALTAMAGGLLLSSAYSSPFWRAWLSWWIGDGVGMIVAAPAVLGIAHWYGRPDSGAGRPRLLLEALFFAAVVVGTLAYAFHRPGALNPFLSVLIFPILILASLRLRTVAPVMTLLATVVVLWFSARGEGPLVHSGLAPIEMAVQVFSFLFISAVSVLALVAVVVERETASEQQEGLRTRLVQTVQTSEAQYRELFDSSPQVLWVFDTETLAFLAVNGAAVARYGYSREEFLGMTIADIRPLGDVPALRASVSLYPGYHEAGFWRHRLRDGTLIDVEIRSHGLTHVGRPAELVMVTDVTDRLRQDREIRALAETLDTRVKERTRELREANADLESFSYSVSHDLKTPLRAIDGYAAFLEEAIGSGQFGDAYRLTGEIRANAQKMAVLIEDLLALSRVGRADLQRREVDLDQLTREIFAQECALSPGRNITLDVGDLPLVLGDAGLLRQALANVLGNAVKFTRQREAAVIQVAGRQDGQWVEVSVRDNGVGFPPEVDDKIFRVFERLHDSDEFEGTGVGLAIVKRIVERHGGEVSAEGRPDHGALIRFTLPAAGERRAAFGADA